MTTPRPTIFGVLMTRNEVDILRLNIIYHLHTNCDRIIVTDNGSTDQTRSVLKRLAKKLPLDWTTEAGQADQGEVVTEMLHEARVKGADWVIPLDTDEFWRTRWRDLPDILADDTESGALEVSRVEYIQARDQRRSNARGALRATMRVPEPLRGVEAIDDFLSERRSMFETEPQPKLIIRATPDVAVRRGGHTASGLAGSVKVTQEIKILHVPLRSRKALERRAGLGAREAAAGTEKYEAIQSKYWSRLGAEGRLTDGWNAHSYEDGVLDVAGRRVELIEDDRLATLLGPWVRSKRSQAIARFARRSW